MPEKVTITVREMAVKLGIGVNTAYTLANSADFYPAFRIGRKLLVNVDKLKEWIDEQTNRGD